MAMMTTVRNLRRTTTSDDPTPKKPALRASRPQRALGRSVVGVLVVGLGAVSGGLAWSATSDRAVVVAAARDIPAGHVITQLDLRAAEVAAPGVAAVSGENAKSLLGQTAIGPIPAGSLISPRMATSAIAPAKGSTAIGIAVKPGQMPAEVTAGRSVRLITTAGDAMDPTAAQAETGDVLAPRAQVVSAQTDPSGSWLVTVAVPEELAGPVATAAAAGRVVLVLLPVGE